MRNVRSRAGARRIGRQVVEGRLLLLMAMLSRGLRMLVRRVLIGATLFGGRPRVRLVVGW
jgi:hypothetical protein